MNASTAGISCKRIPLHSRSSTCEAAGGTEMQGRRVTWINEMSAPFFVTPLPGEAFFLCRAMRGSVQSLSSALQGRYRPELISSANRPVHGQPCLLATAMCIQHAMLRGTGR
jgi:hypothetical protein